MKKRLILLAGLGVGYVLGSRTGRQSYEKLKAQAQDLWADPRVQDTVEKANQSIREKSPAVADAVQTAADKVNSAAGAGAAGAGAGAAGSTSAGTPGATSTGTPEVKDDVVADPMRDLDDEGPSGLSEDT
ncbi:YtxH domain-containing protein [Brevibacterium sp. RIT 803]|uniref:YtxH domain-containing protein n=1 Tax=Brevibacterium sp. RIT 803 TaxID=2810210 RepID=UPI001952820B|nr:YtxH domain-containing protein [Brevibacterium sp. RIT 803]MBM6589704.1 YtxH domain-containing protein [Brevibacterium sp. RIT 803]